MGCYIWYSEEGPGRGRNPVPIKGLNEIFVDYER